MEEVVVIKLGSACVTLTYKHKDARCSSEGCRRPIASIFDAGGKRSFLCIPCLRSIKWVLDQLGNKL